MTSDTGQPPASVLSSSYGHTRHPNRYVGTTAAHSGALVRLHPDPAGDRHGPLTTAALADVVLSDQRRRRSGCHRAGTVVTGTELVRAGVVALRDWRAVGRNGDHDPAANHAASTWRNQWSGGDAAADDATAAHGLNSNGVAV